MKYKLQDLVDVEQLQSLQDTFFKIYSFPTAIIDNNGTVLTATAWQDVCSKFHRAHPESEKVCRVSDRYILSHLHEATPALSYQCPHGLIDMATPILIDGVHYGNFFTGQFFLEQPDLEFFKQQAKKYTYNEEEYLEAISRVPIWSTEKLNNYHFFVKGFIEILAGIGLKKLKEMTNEKQLKESEEKFRSFFENSMDAMLLTSPDGKIFAANPAACSMFGRSESEICIAGREGLADPNDKRLKSVIKEREEKGRGRGEVNMIRKDGSVFNAELSSAIFKDAEGNERVSVIIRDITEQRKAEKEALEQFKLAETFFNHTISSLVILDHHFNFVRVNEAYARACRRNISEFAGRNHFELYPSDAQSIFEEVVRTKHPYTTFTKAFVFPDQPERGITYWDWTLEPVLDNQGEVEFLVFSLNEVTERKRAELLLRENEQKYKSMIETTDTGFLILNEQGEVVDANDEYIRLSGHTTLQEIAGRSVTEWTSPNDLERNAAEVKNCLSTGKTRNLEIEYLNKEGAITPVEINATVVQTEEGKKILALCRDITSRKRAEEIITKSQYRFRNTLDNMIEGCMFIGFDWTYLYLNDTAAQHGHGNRDDLLGHTMQEMYPGIENSEIFMRYQKCMIDGVSQRFESSFTFADGTTNWYEFSVQPVPEGIFVLSIDISNRKKAEDTIRKSKERYKQLLTSVTDYVYSVEIENDLPVRTIHGVNCEAVTGYRQKDYIRNPNLWYLMIHEEDLPLVLKQIDKILLHKTPSVIEHRIIHKNGSTRWVQNSLVPRFDDDERFIAYDGLIKDITEHKELEAVLSEKSRYTRSLIEVSLDPLVTIGQDGKITDVNEATETVTGYDRGKLIGTDISEYFTEPDKARSGYQAVFREGSVHDYPLEIKHRDGHLTPVLYNAAVYRDEFGKVVGVFAAARDITEQKNVKEKLAQSYKQVQELAEHLQTIREDERVSISRDIHDDMGQVLTALKIELSLIESELLAKKKSINPSFILTEVKEMQELINTAILSVRKLLRELRPEVLDNLGILKTIRWQAEEFQKKTGIKCSFNSNIDEFTLDGKRSIAIFRILQEGLTNVLRHSNADLVEIRLSLENGVINLAIEDNGNGFSADVLKERKTMGMIGMRERTLILGGEFKIASDEGKGTTIFLSIPTEESGDSINLKF